MLPPSIPRINSEVNKKSRIFGQDFMREKEMNQLILTFGVSTVGT